jgi:hypothetical protein
VLDANELTDFSDGVWLEFEITGSVAFRFTGVTGPNAVLSGIFFDQP